MKIVKLVLTAVAVLFAALGLFGVLPFAIASPIMFLAMAALFVLRGLEYRRAGDTGGFALSFVIALFVLIVTVYNLAAGGQ